MMLPRHLKLTDSTSCCALLIIDPLIKCCLHEKQKSIMVDLLGIALRQTFKI